MSNKTIINDQEFTCPKCGGHILVEAYQCLGCHVPLLECRLYGDEGELCSDKAGQPQLECCEYMWYECGQCEERIEIDTLIALFGSADDDDCEEDEDN